VRKHLFNISNLHRHVRRKVFAVNFNTTWVDIEVRPDKYFFDEVMESTACLEM